MTDLVARRVAVLSDVHANVVALRAVLAEVDNPDLYVFNGDLTWGSLPVETMEIVRGLGDRVVFVRGNAERAVLELAGGAREDPDAARLERSVWMLAAHGGAGVAFVREAVTTAVVTIDGLGPVRFCHGSPRSDIECLTPETPAERVEEFMAGVSERVLVSGHTHLQYDRLVAGVRIVNPGSVGLPFHDGAPGTAYWAVLGPDVELRSTTYDLDEAVRAFRVTDDPRLDSIEGLMRTPLSAAELIADAEAKVFSD